VSIDNTVPNVGPGTHTAYLTWTDASGQANSFYPDLSVSEKWEEDATATEHPVEQGANVIDHVRVELVKCEWTIFSTNEPIGANNFDDPGQAQNVSVSGNPSPTPGSASQNQMVTAQLWNNELALKGAALAAGGVLGNAIGNKVGGAKGGVIGNAVGGAVGAIVGSLIKPHEVDTPTSIAAGLFPSLTPQGVAAIQFFADPEDYVEATVQLIALLKNTAQIVTFNASKQVIQSMIIESFSYTRSQDEGTGASITIGLKEVRFVQTQTTTVPALPRASTPIKKGDQNPSDGTPAQQQSVALTLAQGGASVVGKIAGALGF
jgi:hypothetical protein